MEKKYSYSHWEQKCANIWHELFLTIKMPQNCNIVEIALGYSAKIIIALSQFNFNGSILIIDPCISATNSIKKKIKLLLPNVPFKIINKPFAECSHQINNFKPNYILSNHPIDDLLIAKNCKNINQLNLSFNKIYNSNRKNHNLFLNNYGNIFYDGHLNKFSSKILQIEIDVNLTNFNNNYLQSFELYFLNSALKIAKIKLKNQTLIICSKAINLLQIATSINRNNSFANFISKNIKIYYNKLPINLEDIF